MECMYKKFFTGSGECNLNYPDCVKKVFCIYEDKYHENSQETLIVAKEIKEWQDT